MGISLEATIALIGVILALPPCLAILWKWMKYRNRPIHQNTHDLERGTTSTEQLPISTPVYVIFDCAPRSFRTTYRGLGTPQNTTTRMRSITSP
ncbi:hypothetical protein F4803DRAFT_156073 [Xylaria telfairii]|nr:hypothetical protein F4803DRAFT_156073 [Xylaria telfairii]